MGNCQGALQVVQAAPYLVDGHAVIGHTREYLSLVRHLIVLRKSDGLIIGRTSVEYLLRCCGKPARNDLVAPTGIEPVLSALKGPRVNQLHHGAVRLLLRLYGFAPEGAKRLEEGS